jgi:gliding motility-associated lipoprotein GldH
MKIKLFIFLIFSILFSCQRKKNEIKIVVINQEKWAATKPLDFEFRTITSNFQTDFLYQVQMNPEFAWENIWLNYCLQGPKGDTLICSTDNLFLFEPKTGKPYGRGCRERLFLDAYFLKNVILKDTGMYKISIRHYLRTDTLQGIQSIGIRMKESGN